MAEISAERLASGSRLAGARTPPRVRGARPFHCSIDQHARNTPARTRSAVPCDIQGCTVSGSPPRVRGAPACSPSWRTPASDHPPARTGSTRCKPHLSRRGPEHPRAYGEHASARRTPPSCASDHPRVCGEHGPVRMASSSGRGITPARTGSTIVAQDMEPRTGTDHPRAYGEHASRPAVPQTTCVLTALHLSVSPGPHETVSHCKSILIHYRSCLPAAVERHVCGKRCAATRDERVASTSAGLSYPGVTVSSFAFPDRVDNRAAWSDMREC